jgi:hypothetical protein
MPRGMILGMIRQLIVPVMLIGAMSTQDSQVLKVRVIFPEGVTDKASMTYGLHDAIPANSHRYLGVSLRAGHSFVEIPATTERFRALVWAPGCRMKHFDVPVEKSDVELQFACEPLNTVPFYGRVKGVEIGDSANISVSYMAVGTCMWLDGWTAASKKMFCCSCGGPQIWGIATAAVAADGAFKVELPDFGNDPIVSGDSSAELEFRISGLKGNFILQPQPVKGIETKAVSIGVAPSYPAEVTFLAVQF